MEATLAVTVFMPDVQYRSGFGGLANPDYEKSGADLSVIPEIYYAARLSDNLVTGIAIAGTAGMGVDYAGTANTNPNNGTFNMKTNLSLLKVVVPVSYTVGGLTMGIAGVLQYGTLDISHGDVTGATSEIGDGESSDIGYGIEVGAAYTTGGLTLGAVYKSKIGMTYDNTIATSLENFAFAGVSGINSGDNLDQPEERGVGISYVMGSNTLSADYKNIAYGDAAGYADFGWENQDVYSVGYEYAADSWALRAGYNYAQSPIVEQDGTTSKGAAQNFFNLAGFPGVVETHYSVGGGMTFGDFTVDGSVIYADETTESYDISALGAASNAEVKHSQIGVTIAGTYKF